MIHVLVLAVTKPGQVKFLARGIGVRHQLYGVKKEHFNAMARSLFQAIKEQQGAKVLEGFVEVFFWFFFFLFFFGVYFFIQVYEKTPRGVGVRVHVGFGYDATCYEKMYQRHVTQLFAQAPVFRQHFFFF